MTRGLLELDVNGYRFVEFPEIPRLDLIILKGEAMCKPKNGVSSCKRLIHPIQSVTTLCLGCKTLIVPHPSPGTIGAILQTQLLPAWRHPAVSA